MAVEAAEIRAVFRDVPTSVAVVSVNDEDGTEHHVTVGSLCAVSQKPPLLSFCVTRQTVAHARYCDADRYCISVLAQGQGTVARHFASRHSGHAGGTPTPSMGCSRLPTRSPGCCAFVPS